MSTILNQFFFNMILNKISARQKPITQEHLDKICVNCRTVTSLSFFFALEDNILI